MRRKPVTVARLVFHTRYWAFRILHSLAMRACPPGRYKTELNAALWTLCLRVQANWAEGKAKEGYTDVA